MDKPRHPHVIRTWTVERTRFPFHDAHLQKQRERAWEARARQSERHPNNPKPAPAKAEPKDES